MHQSSHSNLLRLEVRTYVHTRALCTRNADTFDRLFMKDPTRSLHAYYIYIQNGSVNFRKQRKPLYPSCKITTHRKRVARGTVGGIAFEIPLATFFESRSSGIINIKKKKRDITRTAHEDLFRGDRISQRQFASRWRTAEREGTDAQSSHRTIR